MRYVLRRVAIFSIPSSMSIWLLVLNVVLVIRATSVAKMVDIGDHLARMLTCNGFRKEVEQYREVIDAIEEDDPYTDFFSGLAFKELKAKGLFSGKHDLAIVLCVDGFTSKVSRQSMVMVHVIIPSIDPSIR